MKNAVDGFLHGHPEVSQGDLLVVGVSGGPDSLGLAHTLYQLGHPMIIAHLNHQIRGRSDSDERFVRGFAKSIGVKFRSKRIDVPRLAKQHRTSLEEEAREQRYNFLFGIAAKEGAKVVLVGHTADDQVETVLMHLLRGTGLSGLKGMQPVTTIKQSGADFYLLRPLLSICRSEVLAYCQEHQLMPIFDRSNLDTTFFRNRIRHELIPSMESYNPKIREGILRMTEILAEDYKMFEEIISGVWEECVRDSGKEAVRFDLERFQEQPLAIRRALVRQAVGVLNPQLKDFYFQAVEKALRFLEQPTERKESDLAANLHITLDGESFWIARWGALLQHTEFPLWERGTLVLKLPGAFELGKGWIVRVEKLTKSEARYQEALANNDEYTAWIDGDFVGSEVILRTRKVGEQFQPLGMAGKSIKLADYFINVKIPRLARDSWPLFCLKDEVFWIPGYRQSEASKLRPDSKTYYYFQLAKE